MAPGKKKEAEEAAEAKKPEEAGGGAEPEKPGKAAKPKKGRTLKSAEMTRDEVIRNYLEVYRRCIQEEPKSFDAKGALSALDQISKLLGLETPIKAADIDGNRIVLTLSDEVGDRGD